MKLLILINLPTLLFTISSCSLNPLENLLTSTLSVQIFQNERLSTNYLSSQSLTQVPAKPSEFDCLVFNVTGYGIPEYETEDDFGIPLQYFRWAKPSNSVKDHNLSFDPQEYLVLENGNETIKAPIKISFLPGLELSRQKRQINLYGVIPSTGKSCKGKTISQILQDDNDAQFYAVGTSEYPSNKETSCDNGAICIPANIDSIEYIKNTTLKYFETFKSVAYLYSPDTSFISIFNLVYRCNASNLDMYFSNDSTGKQSENISNANLFLTSYRNGSELPNSQEVIRLCPRGNNEPPRLDFAMPISKFVLKKIDSISLEIKRELQFQNSSECDLNQNFENYSQLYDIQIFSSNLKSDASGYELKFDIEETVSGNGTFQKTLTSKPDFVSINQKNYLLFSIRLVPKDPAAISEKCFLGNIRKIQISGD